MEEQGNTDSKALRQAWGDWVKNYDWSHAVTLTTARPFSPERLKKAFDEEWIRYATKTAQRPVQYFFAIEGGALGDQAHIHALVAGTSTLECGQLVKAWRHGRRVTVAVYDPQRGAAHYFTKEIGERILDYGWSNRMPPLRDKAP